MPETLSPRQLLAQLVAFPTVSRESNLPLVDWVETYLNSHDIPCHRKYDATGKKAALFAHVGPEVPGGVVLSGHTDVVPVAGQEWDTDPFELVEKDGRLFGRGSCDMKGFDALAIWALVKARYDGVRRPLQLGLSYDEEIGCLGAPPMIEAMAQKLPKADTVIVGEPSMMKVVSGHKGGIAYRVRVQGFEVHSSIMHRGVNAIMYGAKIIEWANQMNAANAAKVPGPMAADFDPPYTTLHVGQIQGGTAHNITAKECRFSVDFRVVPGESAEAWTQAFYDKVREVEAEMQAVVPETKIVMTSGFYVPALAPENDGSAEELARRITGDNGRNVVSYATEGGQFQEGGYSVVVCGPGNIEQAHQPNEFIEVSQLNAGQKFMADLIAALK
jgi:acetylornithine deacetylase